MTRIADRLDSEQSKMLLISGDTELILFGFLYFSDVLSIRTCCRELYFRYNPWYTKLWNCVRSSFMPDMLSMQTECLSRTRMLCQSFQITEEGSWTKDILRIVCNRGHLQTCKWLVKTYNPLVDLMFDVFVEAYRNNHTEVVKWLLTEYNDVHLLNRVFRKVCADGDVALAKWVAKKLGTHLAIDDGLRMTIFHACDNRRFPIIKWLIGYIKYTKFIKNIVIRSGFMRKIDIKLALWLIRVLNIKLTDVLKYDSDYTRPFYYKIFIWYAKRSRYDQLMKADWIILHVTVSMTGTACRCGDLSALRWLIQFADDHNLSYSTSELFYISAMRGHLDIIKWMFIRFSEEISKYTSDYLVESVVLSLNVELVKFVKDRLKIDDDLFKVLVYGSADRAVHGYNKDPKAVNRLLTELGLKPTNLFFFC